MNGKRRDRKGFTLIELSIVLIIIGLLLAAIVKGKDLIRSAELKKFYNGFVKQWELLFNNYYDRTGKVLGAPLVVKETSNSTYDSYVGADLTDTNTDLVIRDPRRFKTFDNTAINNNNGYYANTIIAAGLTLPNPVRGYSNMFDITATEVGRASVIVTFGSDPVANGKKLYFYKYATNVAVNGTAENKGGVVEDNVSNTSIDGHGDGRGNFMLLINLPYDVAPQIDKIIDEKTDATKGNFICVNSYTEEQSIDNISLGNIIDTTHIQDLSSLTDCGGPLGWGNSTNRYVTGLYKLEF